MKTTNRETIKLTVNILIRKFCEDKAAKNFSMGKQEAEDYGACEETSLREEDKELLRTAFARMELRARAYHKILKLARTAADLSGDAQITRKHLLEVLQYRSLDRKYLL